MRKKGTKTILFQQGTYVGKQVPVYLRGLNYDYFLCWGNIFKKKLKSFNPKLEILAFGRIGRNYKKVKKTNSIIFSSQDTGSLIDEKNNLDYYSFCEWCLDTFKNYKIIFKPHPKYEPLDKVQKFLNIKILNY